MKKTLKLLKKILVVIMILLMLNNFMTIPIVKASSAIGEEGQGFFLSFLGLLTMPVRAIVIGLAYAVNMLTAAIAYIEGATAEASTSELDMSTITPFDIFFNKVRILDINFFEIGDDVTIVNTIRTGIAAWYYALRLIALSILLVILIYVGIRMAISTIATDKAMYKKMLYDWVVSLVLVFFINYIIVFIINLNNIIVDAIAKGVDNTTVSETYDTIKNLALAWFDIDAIPATIIFCMLVAQTLGLVITYFNRMLKVAFLIIISPLITLTYAVDKMGDGKAQALGNWLREFFFTVTIQIFHCIIYMSMINVAFELLIEHSGKGIRHALITAVMAILCVNFVKTAEDLVRKILMHNHQDNSVSVAGGMAATAVALQKSKQLGGATRKAVNATKDNIRMAKSAIKAAPKKVAGATKAIVTAPGKLGSAIRSEADWLGSKERAENRELRKTDKERYKAVRKQTKSQHKAERIENRKNIINKAITSNKKLKAVNGKATEMKEKLDARKAVKATKKAEKAKRKANKPVGALTRLSNFKHKLDRVGDQNKTVKAIGNLVKGTTAVSMGVFTGSMMYGATGKVEQAVGMGVAGYRMHREFQKSARTMETSTVSSLIGAGARTKEKAFELLHEVASNPNQFDGQSGESVKKAEELLKRIGEQLEKFSLEPKHISTIRNELNTTALKAPEKTGETINRVLDEIARERFGNDDDDESVKNRKSITEDTGLREACNEYAKFSNMKQIYSQMQNAQAMDISQDSFVQDCTQRFVSMEVEVQTEDTSSESTESYTDSTETDNHEQERTEVVIEESSDTRKEPEKMDVPLKDLNISDAIARVEEERARLEEMAASGILEESRASFEEAMRKLETQERELAARIVSEENRALEESQKTILENARKACVEEIERALKEVDLAGIDKIESYSEKAREIATRYKDSDSERASMYSGLANEIDNIDKKLKG